MARPRQDTNTPQIVAPDSSQIVASLLDLPILSGKGVGLFYAISYIRFALAILLRTDLSRHLNLC